MSDLNTAEDVRTDDELDLLAEQTETARNSERPMTEADIKDKPTKEEVFEFTHSGKPIKATRDQIIKWAQMGYDRPQVIAKLNQERQQWENQKKDWEQKYSPYKQIDEYAKQNKEWWDHILKGWTNRGTYTPGTTTQTGAQNAALPPEVTQKLSLLEQKLSKTDEFINSLLQEKQQAVIAKQDQDLDQEIRDLRGKHSELDWDSLDENGKNLEVRILDHAQNNGIPTFRAALRDLLFDDLQAMAASQGKIAVAKGIQAKTKLGVLGESPTSAKFQPEKNRNIRQTSYEQLLEEAKEEIRQMRS